ncbi:MAG: RecB family exonuclease [Candidatus Zixiibacteriota bacterium]
MLSNYSYSALEAFLSCPRKYKFQYLDRVEVPKRITADAYMGNAVHRALDRLYQVQGEGYVMSREELLAVYLGEWEKPDKQYITVISEYQTVGDYIAAGQKMLETYYDKFHPFTQGVTIGSEMNLRFEIEHHETRFAIKAKIDRLWKRNDGVMEICDYKTGRMPQEGVQSKFFLHQMGLYQLAVQSKYPHWTDIELAQYFLKYDEVLRRRLRPDELDELQEQTRVNILETLQAERLDNFPPQEGGLCNYCEYYDLCPAKRHKLILEAEEGAGSEEKDSARVAAELTDRYIELYIQLKELEAEQGALREDLVRAAKDLKMGKFSGIDGEVIIKIGQTEKFITKSIDPKANSELNAMVRNLGMDEYFKLDESAFMREIYQKERLAPEILESLKKYIVTRESPRVSVRLHQSAEDDI